jgi:hypothetical protein
MLTGGLCRELSTETDHSPSVLLDDADDCWDVSDSVRVGPARRCSRFGGAIVHLAGLALGNDPWHDWRLLQR